MKSGTLCDLEIVLAARTGWGVSSDAVLPGREGRMSLFLDEGGRAKETTVLCGLTTGGITEILSFEPLLGKAVIVRRNGEVAIEECLEPKTKCGCVFERIYFSRANDADIHRERRELGRRLAPAAEQVISDDAVDVVHDILQLSNDLNKHSVIEEKVLVPYVKHLEEVVVS